MASKPKLKWRKVKGEWRAGPFMVDDIGPCAWGSSGWFRLGLIQPPSSAKAACQRLANEITRAMKPCGWTYDEYHDAWDTGCGEKHQFIEGGPADNSYKFCPYCGEAMKPATKGKRK